MLPARILVLIIGYAENIMCIIQTSVKYTLAKNSRKITYGPNYDFDFRSLFKIEAPLSVESIEF